MRRSDWRIPAAWLTLCIVWSSTWLAIKVGLRDLPPVSFVGLRFVVAIAVLVAVSIGRVRLLPPKPSDYLILAVTGVLMFGLNYTLLFWGELHVSSGLAAVLQTTIPIFGMLFAHWMLPDEPLRLQKLLGALLAIAGVSLICGRLLDFGGVLAFWGGVGIVLGGASAADSNRARDAGRVANDLWHNSVAHPRRHRRWKSGALSLDHNVNLLFALPRHYRFVPDLFVALLVAPPHVGHKFANDLAHYSTRRGDAGLGFGRRKISSLVALRRGRRPCGCLDNFSPN